MNQDDPQPRIHRRIFALALTAQTTINRVISAAARVCGLTEDVTEFPTDGPPTETAPRLMGRTRLRSRADAPNHRPTFYTCQAMSSSGSFVYTSQHAYQRLLDLRHVLRYVIVDKHSDKDWVPQDMRHAMNGRLPLRRSGRGARPSH
jgi:hypothetical protein